MSNIYQIGTKRAIVHDGVLFIEAEPFNPPLATPEEEKQAKQVDKKSRKKYTKKSAVKDAVAKVKKAENAGKRKHLTDEEKEQVLGMCLAGGKTTNEIAEEFGVSMGTVYGIKAKHAEESEDVDLPEETKQREWMCSRCGETFHADPEDGEEKPTCRCDASGGYITEIK